MSKGFNEWMGSLNLVNHDGIPDDWFEEFWQHSLRCKLENSSVIQVSKNTVNHITTFSC